MDVLKSFIDISKSEFDKYVESIDMESVKKAAEIIIEAKNNGKRLHITGIGKPAHIAGYAASLISSTGTPTYFLHGTEAVHGSCGQLAEGDIVICISNSGETGELLNLLPLLHRFNVPVISMTGNLNSTLAKMGSVVIDISVEKEACPLGKAPTASTTATLAMGDAIAVCLLKKRGFTTEDFLLYHPSGALGKGILYTVEELMLKGENVPLISEKVDFKEALTFITEKKLGTAIIINENGVLTGVLTDGDIRRILIKYDNISNLKLQDVMTRNPKTISKVDLCAKALSIMERHSITSLAVVDDNQIPIGIIHIHDLLKAGVA